MYVRKIIAAIVAIALAVLAWLNLFYHINDKNITTKVKDLSSMFVVAKINRKPKAYYNRNLVQFNCLRYFPKAYD